MGPPPGRRPAGRAGRAALMAAPAAGAAADPREGGAPPPSPFAGGLGAFLRRREVRAVVWQIVAISIAFAAFAWMGGNVVRNLEALGKDFSFRFLANPAGYDINQRLIEYSSLSTNGRAMLVGILNTAIVAACGIVLATVIGLVVAVSRLSPNWLVSRMAYVYVEAVRNVPVLLQIILLHALTIESFPNPRDGEAPLSLLGVAFASNRGLFLPRVSPGEGFWPVWVALALSVAALWAIARASRRRRAESGEGLPTLLLAAPVLVLPALLVFLALGSPASLSLPEPGRFSIQGGLPISPEFFALWIALSIYTGAFIAEVIRSGIVSVSKGQKEAAAALGLRRMRALRLVVLPQAMRVAVPPITNQYLNLTKNSSLAIAVGYQDIVGTIGGTTLNVTGREMECMILVLSIYLAFSLVISAVLNVYNRSIKLVER